MTKLRKCRRRAGNMSTGSMVTGQVTIYALWQIPVYPPTRAGLIVANTAVFDLYNVRKYIELYPLQSATSSNRKCTVRSACAKTLKMTSNAALTCTNATYLEQRS